MQACASAKQSAGNRKSQPKFQVSQTQMFFLIGPAPNIEHISLYNQQSGKRSHAEKYFESGRPRPLSDTTPRPGAPRTRHDVCQPLIRVNLEPLRSHSNVETNPAMHAKLNLAREPNKPTKFLLPRTPICTSCAHSPRHGDLLRHLLLTVPIPPVVAGGSTHTFLPSSSLRFVISKQHFDSPLAHKWLDSVNENTEGYNNYGLQTYNWCVILPQFVMGVYCNTSSEDFIML